LYLFVSSFHKLAQTLQYISSLIIYKKEKLANQLDYNDTMTLLGNEKRYPHFKILCVIHMLFQKYQILVRVSQWHMIHIFMTAADLSCFMTVIAGQCHGSGS